MRGSVLLIPYLLLLCLGGSPAAAQLGEAFPTALAYDVAIYPPLARQARIQGEVRLEIITDGKSVVTATAISGQPLLAGAAEQNALTWRFEPHKPTKFTMTYEYKLSDGPAKIAWRSPGTMEITAGPPTVIADSWPASTGPWKLTVKTQWGESEMTAMLGGAFDSVKTSDGTEFHVNCPIFEGSHVEFCVKTVLPGTRIPTMVLYKGQMNSEAMAGTFSDAEGTQGTWSAERRAPPETQPISSETDSAL